LSNAATDGKRLRAIDALSVETAGLTDRMRL